MDNKLPASPYNPLQPAFENFIGRANIIRSVISHFDANFSTPILVFGPRRIGKTSFIEALARELQKNTCAVVITAQGQGRANILDMVKDLAIDIADTLDSDILDTENIDITEYGDFTGKFVPRLISELEKNKKNLIVLVDEVDALDVSEVENESAALNFLPLLEQVHNRYRTKISFVFVIGKPLSSMAERFSNSILVDCEPVNIGELSRQENDLLVTSPAIGYLKYSPDALEEIFLLTHGQPCFSQLLCSVLWKTYQQLDNLELPVSVSSNDIQDTIEEALLKGSAALTSIYKDWSAIHRVILSVLADDAFNDTTVRREEIIERLLRRGVNLDNRRVFAVLDELQQWNLVSRVDDGYRISSPFFAHFINDRFNIGTITETLAQIDPALNTLVTIGNLYLRQGKYEEAVTEFQKIEFKQVDALRLFRAERLCEAYMLWFRSITPGNLEHITLATYFALDLLEARTQHWQLAIDVLNELIEALPLNSSARTELVRGVQKLHSEGRTPSTIEALRQTTNLVHGPIFNNLVDDSSSSSFAEFANIDKSLLKSASPKEIISNLQLHILFAPLIILSLMSILVFVFLYFTLQLNVIVGLAISILLFLIAFVGLNRAIAVRNLHLIEG